MNSRITSIAFFLAAILWLAADAALGVELLFFDNFDSATATVGDDSDDLTDIEWTGSDGSNLSVADDNREFSEPNALYNNGGSHYRYGTGAIPSLQSLDHLGDSLVLDMQFTTNNAGGLNNQHGTANGYQIGLFAPDGQGYYINLAAGNDFSDFSWNKDVSADADLAGSSGNDQLVSFGTGAPTIDDYDYDKITLGFVQTGGGISVAAHYADNQAATPVSLSTVDTTASLTQFDRVMVGLGTHGIDYRIDDVQLQRYDSLGYLTNGDFEQGNVGFDSNYTFDNNNPAGGRYGIVSDPNSWFGPMSSFGDHTTGSGLMLVGDGSTVTDNMVLGWTVPVVEGMRYRFTGYFAEAGGGTSSSQQLFEVRLDDQVLGQVDLDGLTPGDWQELLHEFNATETNPTARLTIHALRTGGGGNNFAIDDISFMAVPEPSAAALLLLGLVGLILRRRR